jgi:hypothetical protein
MDSLILRAETTISSICWSAVDWAEATPGNRARSTNELTLVAKIIRRRIVISCAKN